MSGLPMFAIYVFALMTSMAGMELASTVLAVWAIIFQIRNWQGVKALKIGPDLWLGLFVAMVILSAIINSPSWKSASEMIGWCRWVILLYSFTWLLRVSLTTRLERWHLGFLGLTIVIGVNSIYQFFTGIDVSRPGQLLNHLGQFYRASGFFKMGLTFAYSIGMMGMTALALALLYAKDRQWRRCLWTSLAFLACSLSVFLSMTRGAWIALAAATLLGLLLVSVRWFLIFVPVAVGLVSVLTVTNQTLVERFFSIFDGDNYSNSTRYFLWRANLLLFREHPLLGASFEQTPAMMTKYYGQLGDPQFAFFGHPHSDLLQMLAGLGIFGFIGYVGLCTWFLRTAYRLWVRIPEADLWFRALALGSFLAQIYFHIGGLTQCNFTDGEVNHVLIFLWSITAVLAGKYPTRTVA